MKYTDDDLLAAREGVLAGYGFETTTCGGGWVAVCASDWRTVDRHWLSQIETGVWQDEWDKEVTQ